ncbi:MAG: hypothetical protein UV85_C0018G0003 [Candidatus Nomurabacteria bacterium GW2011_GWB1_43_19]|nr:MAG: hypothetical protein UV85_C0018G0003 [Candidatus Nomurabacteria bacterium GW2011_GWB1_43_19]
MIKKFSSPKIKIWFEPMFFSGLFCGFERCGSAAFQFWFASLRSATNSYSILGVKTNSRFRILGEENF